METATIEKTGATRNEVYKREFGKRFSAALDARALSRSEAARIAGVNPGRITEYSKGVRLVPLDTLDEIVGKLDLDPRILFPQWFARARVADAVERSRRVREELDLSPGLDEPVESGRF